MSPLRNSNAGFGKLMQAAGVVPMGVTEVYRLDLGFDVCWDLCHRRSQLLVAEERPRPNWHVAKLNIDIRAQSRVKENK